MLRYALQTRPRGRADRRGYRLSTTIEVEPRLVTWRMLAHHHPEVQPRPEAGTAIVSKPSPQGHGSTVTVPAALPVLVAQTVVEPQNHEGKITLAPGPIVAGPAALADAASPTASASAMPGTAISVATRSCQRRSSGEAEVRAAVMMRSRGGVLYREGERRWLGLAAELGDGHAVPPEARCVLARDHETRLVLEWCLLHLAEVRRCRRRHECGSRCDLDARGGGGSALGERARPRLDAAQRAAAAARGGRRRPACSGNSSWT